METILILRGWGSEVGNWNQFVGLLEGRGYKVYTPDLPGFGTNLAPSRAWSIDDYVDWVKDYCEKQNLSQFFLLGHSFGGGIAVKYSLKCPGSVKKLILMDAAVIRKKTKQKEKTKKAASFFKKLSFLPFYSQIRKIIYRLIFKKSDYVYTEGVMKETYLKVIDEDLTDHLSNISVPVTIIWGEKDDLTPIEDAYLIKQKILKSNLEIIPNIYHNPHSEDPEKLTEIILKFL